jgi:hypothetical protein
MPFTPTGDLPDNPAVRIFFSGLMILKPDAEGKTCEVFVHRSAPAHHLTIEVRRKRAGYPDEIMMRHVGPLAFGVTLSDDPDERPIHGFFIRKGMQTPGEKGVRRYNPAQPPAEGKPESLSLAIDLEGAQFHNGSVGPVDDLGGRPSIFIDDATFYTAAKTRPELIIKLKKEGHEDQQLAPFASLIGANIYLEDESTVALSFSHQGRFETLELTKPTSADISYEIYIVNDPLYENDSPNEPKHDEFKEYYKILPAIPTSEQFSLDISVATPTERGTTRTPCMSVIIGGTGGGG